MHEASAKRDLLARRWPMLTGVRQLAVRVALLVKTSGLPDAMVVLCSTVLEAVSLGSFRMKRFYVVVQPTAAPILHNRLRRASMLVRQATMADVTAGVFPRPIAELEERITAGSMCLVAESKGSLVGFIWFHPGVFLDPTVSVRFMPVPASESVWDFDVYIDPAHRNGLAFYRLWQAACQHLCTQGIRWSVSQISARNTDSLRAHLALGAYVVGSALQLHIGRGILTISMRPARFFVTWPEREPPVFQVDAAALAPRRYRRFGITGAMRRDA